jgi:hypothetical protein
VSLRFAGGGESAPSRLNAIVDALPVVALTLTHIRNTVAQHGQRGPGPTVPDGLRRRLAGLGSRSRAGHQPPTRLRPAAPDPRPGIKMTAR